MLSLVMRAFQWSLRCTQQYDRGVANAEAVELSELKLYFATLPRAFDGFTILHLSDLHLDGMSGVEQRLLRCIDGRSFDLCVLTGDYRQDLYASGTAVMASLRSVVSGVRAREGTVAVLGNHDGVHMVPPMEEMGIRVLLNEHTVLQRGEQRLQIIGTDDVHYYHTERAELALEVARAEFTIALVHSPELCDAAAAAGVDLYLCGHTHAGQVCLPGGIPIIVHLRRGRAYYKGTWRHRGMRGVTSGGVGTSGIPVRFNTRPEAVAITLRRRASGNDGEEP